MEALDAATGAVPAASPVTKEQLIASVIAVAPSTVPEPPAERWSKGKVLTFLIVASIIGWGAIIALIVALV